MNYMKESRWKSFLGGSNIIFTIVLVILIGLFFIIFRQLDFLFNPIVLIASNLFMLILVSLLLYYLSSPIIDFMERHKITRVWGIAILYIVAIFLLVGIVAVLYPVLADQVVSLTQTLPAYIENTFNSTVNFVNEMFPNSAIQQVVTQVQEFVSGFFSNFSDIATQALSGLSSIISSITTFVVTIVMAPIILFFLLKDDQKMVNGFLKIIPPKWRPDFLEMGAKINLQVGAYIKGQLTVALVNGVLMFIGFFLIGLNYSGILGIAGGILSVIPYLGPTLTFVPALIVALMDSWFKAVLLIGVWLVIQFIEGNFVEPNVMGRQLKVHPLTIIIMLIVMGDLLGILGLIFGIPIYAIIKVIVKHFFQKFKNHYNKYYGDSAGEYAVDETKDWNFGDDNILAVKDQYIDRVAERDVEENENKNND